MKKEELTEIGLTEEQIQKVFAINGRDIEAKKAEITRVEGERDNFKNLYDTADAELKKFEGVDPAALQDEIKKSKDALAAARADFDQQMTKRDQDDWLGKKYDEYGVSSPYARKQLSAESQDPKTGLQWKEKSFYGFDDFMADAKKKDPTLYKTEEDKGKDDKKEDDPPAFTGPAQNGPKDGGKKYVPPTIF